MCYCLFLCMRPVATVFALFVSVWFDRMLLRIMRHVVTVSTCWWYHALRSLFVVFCHVFVIIAVLFVMCVSFRRPPVLSFIVVPWSIRASSFFFRLSSFFFLLSPFFFLVLHLFFSSFFFFFFFVLRFLFSLWVQPAHFPSRMGCDWR